MKKEGVIVIGVLGIVAVGTGIWFATTIKPTTKTTTGATTTTTQNQNQGALSWLSGLLSGVSVVV